MARTINNTPIERKAIDVRTEDHRADIHAVETALESNKFFPIKANYATSSNPKAVGLFSGNSDSGHEYNCALNSLKSEISDYMFSNPDESITDIEDGLKMFISHKMDRASYSAKEASKMTTYAPSKNKFLHHLAQWNSKWFKDPDQSRKSNPRKALNYVFANKGQNVQKQILAEGMSTILIIKSFITDNKDAMDAARIPKEGKREIEGVLPVDNRIVPNSANTATVNQLKDKCTQYAVTQRNKIVNIVSQNRFDAFKDTLVSGRDRETNTTTSPRSTSGDERLSEFQKIFKGLDGFQLNQAKKHNENNRAHQNDNKRQNNNVKISNNKSTKRYPPNNHKSYFIMGDIKYQETYPEEYPVKYKDDFRLNVKGVKAPSYVFARDHDFINNEIRHGDLKKQLINQYTSIEKQQANIMKAKFIQSNGTPEEKKALAEKWGRDYLVRVRALKPSSGDELNNLVLDRIIKDKNLNNQALKVAAQNARSSNNIIDKKRVVDQSGANYLAAIQEEQKFEEYSDEKCADVAIGKYIQEQQNVQMVRSNNDIQQPRLDNIVRMMTETNPYHHMLVQAIVARATFVELSSANHNIETKAEYRDIANKEIARLKELANTPKAYAASYTFRIVDPNHNQNKMNKIMATMFNQLIEEIGAADTDDKLQGIYEKVVGDWLSRGETIPVNMIADYAQALNIPQKYVKAFITHAKGHYEFANLTTPGDGMNCGLYSLLMLAFAYYNPESRAILDELMNNKKYTFTQQDADRFNKAIQDSKAHFDRDSGAKTVLEILESIQKQAVNPQEGAPVTTIVQNHDKPRVAEKEIIGQIDQLKNVDRTKINAVEGLIHDQNTKIAEADSSPENASLENLATRISKLNLNCNEMFGNGENDSDLNDGVVDQHDVERLYAELEQELSDEKDMKDLILPHDPNEIEQNRLILSKLLETQVENMIVAEEKQAMSLSTPNSQDLEALNNFIELENEVQQKRKVDAEQGLTVVNVKDEAQKFFTDRFEESGKTWYTHLATVIVKAFSEKNSKKYVYDKVNLVINLWLSTQYETLPLENRTKLKLAILEQLRVRAPRVYDRYCKEFILMNPRTEVKVKK